MSLCIILASKFCFASTWPSGTSTVHQDTEGSHDEALRNFRAPNLSLYFYDLTFAFPSLNV